MKDSIKFTLIGIGAVAATCLVIWGMIAGFDAMQGTPLTNQQIIEQSDYCTKHGYKVDTFIAPLTGETMKIQCGEKK